MVHRRNGRVGRAALAVGLFLGAAPPSTWSAAAVQKTRPASGRRRIGFENGIPAWVRADGGLLSVVEDGSAARGKACLRYERSSGRGRGTVLLLSIPSGSRIGSGDRLSAWVRAGATGRSTSLRWLALGGDERVLFQRRFEVASGGEWAKVEWDLFRWRWGDGRVGDWSRVRTIALRVGAGSPVLWLDEIRLDAGARVGGPARGAGEEWLCKLAFSQRPLRTAVAGDFRIYTDATKGLNADEIRRIAAQAGRVRAWVRRSFGDAAGPVGDASMARLLVFDSRRDYRTFFHRLGRQWACSIAPPEGGGYTVQDIAAASYDARYGADCPVFLHEMVHVLIAREVRIPTGTARASWFHEGLANYLQLCVYPESMDWDAYARNFRQPIGRGTFFRPLGQIVGRRVMERHYSQLAGLIAFLASEKPLWLREIAHGLAADRKIEAVLDDLGTDLRHLEELWFAWGKRTLRAGGGPARHFPPPREWSGWAGGDKSAGGPPVRVWPTPASLGPRE